MLPYKGRPSAINCNHMLLLLVHKVCRTAVMSKARLFLPDVLDEFVKFNRQDD